MWLYDIGYNAYSPDMNRQFFLVKRYEGWSHSKAGHPIKFPKRRWEKEIYTVVEEWHTPESKGDTGDWDYYTFMTYREAAIFIAELIMKLNSPQQNILFKAAENLATDITKNHKRAVKKMQAEQKKNTKFIPKN